MHLFDFLQSVDERLFWLLHAHHTPWLDGMMWYISKMYLWIPVYLWMLIMMFKRLSSVEFITACIGLGLLLFLTDFAAVKLVKETAQRLRPSHHPELQQFVQFVLDDHGNPYRGGRYGFFSNHASNYAGVVMFFFLLLRPFSKAITALLVLWVVLISYSRIYLGVHYPFDILAGWIYGMLCGWFVYRQYHRLTSKPALS